MTASGSIRVVGIDPGISGALALVVMAADRTVRHVRMVHMPTLQSKSGKGTKNSIVPEAVADILRDWMPQRIVIELVGVMPGEGPVGAFRFGHAAGLVLGVTAGLSIPWALVPPQVWKRSVGIAPGSPKDASVAKALSIHPSLSTELKLKRDIGRAEAFLIAYHAARGMEAG